MQTLTLTAPDDWHLHLRDGEALRAVAPITAASFRRAICMPNTKPPVRTVAEAGDYRARILDAVQGADFEPLMVLYLTDSTTPDEIVAAAQSDFVHAVKLYPAGATTNSDSGVTDLALVEETLAAMAETGLPLLVHGEVTHGHVDIFDREKTFLDQVLAPLLARFPRLRVVLEHITTAEGVAFVQRYTDGRVGGTLTAHHLILNRNALFEGGIRPHRYCLPVLKRETHRQALVQAATSGDSRFFLGTDSAPHPRSAKESACGCAGMFTASHAMGLYAEVFEDAGALHHLEGFASHHGPDWYGLPRNPDSITLERVDDPVPAELPFGDEVVVPFRPGGAVRWRIRA